MNKLIIILLGVFFVPVIISSMSLKVAYRINSINREIEKYERDNAYLKKKLFEQTNLAEIQKKAFAMGFDLADPSTIVIIENKKTSKLIAKVSILKDIKNIFIKNDKT